MIVDDSVTVLMDLKGLVDFKVELARLQKGLKSTLPQIEKIEKIDKPPRPPKVVKIQFPQPTRSGQRVMVPVSALRRVSIRKSTACLSCSGV